MLDSGTLLEIEGEELNTQIVPRAQFANLDVASGGVLLPAAQLEFAAAPVTAPEVQAAPVTPAPVTPAPVAVAPLTNAPAPVAPAPIVYAPKQDRN